MNRILFLIMVLFGSMSASAQTDGYNPANPPLPEAQYKLTIGTTPSGAGTVNTNSAVLVNGESVDLYAYTNANFKFIKWVDAKADTIVSTEQKFYYTMPASDVQLTAVYKYDPENPKNPGRNKFDSSTGEVIVDDFTPGSLSSAIQEVVGSKSSDIVKITVMGIMSNNDFGVANDYEKCSILDLSRVTGIAEIPSYAFDNTNLETIYLPATIEKIGTRAFAGCTKLSSLTIYAMTPPVLESNVFQGVPEDFIVYVPMAAISQYQDVEAWGKFTLLPIQEDICNINVSLPQGTNTADYAQMWLELTNKKSGQRMHYVMTDRMQYTFADIICNTSWNVTLRNERGDIFGQIDNVEVKDEDVNVMFCSLSKPQSVVVSVLTPDGQDVTSQTKVTWTDTQGNYLSQSFSLKGLPTGYQATCTIVLPQQLAMAYNSPNPVNYVLTDDNNKITYHLNAIPQLKISGKVKDASTGISLSGVIISASQTFGGRYSKTLNAKTDRNGVFTLDIANVPTSVAYAASSYISKTINCDSLLTGTEEVVLPDVSLTAITGATITLGFTYTSCDGETLNWYSDYQNVNYELFNVTQNKVVSQYNVQYPQIVLLEDIADGDVLKLTATSRTNAFMPVTTATTIVGQKAEATFAVVELGKIQASFTSTGNTSVVGALYDSVGKLMKTYDYSNASLTISDLADGKYTLVSMGSSRLFNTIYDLSQLPQTGLAEGTDYIQNSVEIKSGQVSTISIVEVPTLDESKIYYTGDNTSFMVNKSIIVVGNYLTLTGHLDFKPAYATSVSNVQMIVDLPESCEFVENSVIVGNSTSSYTVNGHKVTIPMARYTDRVRFCIIPTLGGEYAPSAFAQFDLNGETVTQPIGSANYTAKNLSISVPSMVAKTTIPVSGTAIGTSNIEIYDNDVLIGNISSLANGTWEATCELNNPYNLSTHNINAKVTTKTGVELISETKQVVYDINMVVPEKVTMLYYNPEFVGQYNIVFDFINRSVSPKFYYFFPYKSYPDWYGSGTEPKDFTFVADLSNNDSTAVNGVTIRVYTDNGYWRNLKAQYNISMKRWIAVSQFTEEEAPVGVEVEIDSNSHPTIEAAAITSVLKNVEETISDFEVDLTTLSTLLDNFSDELNNGNSIQDTLLLKLSHEISTPIIINKDVQISDSDIEALLERCDSTLENGTIQSLKDITNTNIYELNGLSEYLNGIKITSCNDISEEQLLLDGFITIEKTDGSKLYIHATESVYEIVDFEANMHISVSSESPLFINAYKANDNDTFEQQMMNGWEKLNFFCDKLNSTVQAFTGAIESICSTLEASNSKLAKEIGELFDDALYLQRNNGNKFLLGLIDAKIHTAVLAKQANTKIISWINNNLKSFKVGKNFGKACGVFGIIMDIQGAIQDMHQIVSLYNECLPCPNDEANAKSIQGKLRTLGFASIVFYGAQLTSDIAAVVGAESGIFAAIPTGGSSLAAVGVSIGLVAANFIACQAYTKAFEKNINTQRNRIKSLKCKKDKCPRCGKNPCECKDKCPRCGNKPCTCPKKCPRCGKKPCVCPPPTLRTGVQHDPSGYVYEGVASNRIQGVKASCYYKETVEDMYGDLHEDVVLWNAEEYAQENPLFTDEYGMYRWDVPKGMWQVKFEKEGYETTYSEWLPVPPPQLDVNIAMKQNRQPEVKDARAYEAAVEVEFDKYMMPEMLTAENIMVMQNGNVVDGTVELLNEEVSYEGEEETFASKIRFNATQPFTEQEVTLLVNNRVKSYAGIRMQDDYQQTFAIEQEVKRIVCDSVVTVGYGNTSAFVVSVLPVSASKGKTLIVKTSSPMILGVETEQVTIGNDGTAEIIVSGDLPGTTALTFTVEGTDKTAMMMANVEQSVIKTVATPKASIASGTIVEKGTAITLTCETEGATIYYTLDGSCPCENAEGRKIYDGTPIIINENVTIKAMAMAPGMYESDVAEFTYIVDATTGIDDTNVNIQIQIYPLPVRDKVNVSASGRTIKSVTVSSMNGTVVASTSKPATVVTINISPIAAGVYIVNIKTEDNVYSRKVLIVQ